MQVKAKLGEQLLEAIEEVGLVRAELLSAAGVDGATFSDPRGFPWSTYVALVDQTQKMLGGDVERMRDVGRAMARAPSWRFLQRLARTVVSARSLHELATRWGSRAAFPHLPLELSRVSERRLRYVRSIPEPHAPCAAFFRIFEGVLVEATTLLGLSRGTIVTSEVTPRTMDTVVELPLSTSVLARARHALGAVVHSRDVPGLLDEQRRDIAEGLREVQRSTQEIRQLLDRLPHLVMVHRDGVIVWMNRANLRTLGYDTSTDVVGRPLLDLVDPVSRAMIRARMTQPASSDLPELTELGLMTRDGRVAVIEIAPAQIVTFEGRPARLVVGRDITERVRLRAQLLITDRMATIGMLAAGVAHEVNNPLGYVLNNIEVAAKALAALGEESLQSHQALGVALEGVERIRTIVRDLLALSRIDDAGIGPVDVVAVVESTLALARKNISERALVSFEHEPVPLVRGSSGRLGQVLVNLIANALEAMPRDTDARSNELRIVVRRSGGGGVLVEVVDNGDGIAPSIAPRIFEPFFTTKAPGGGTGLGLAISMRLVVEMGGMLSYEPAGARGSVFRLALERAEPDSC